MASDSQSRKEDTMKKRNIIWLFCIILCLINLFIFKFAAAEIIVLKSGERIEANVIKKTPKYVVIDYKGASISYYVFEIKSINGEAIDLPVSNSAPLDVVKVDIINAQEYLKRGALYHSKGNFDQAVSDFNKAIKTDPNYAPAYANRGLAYSGKKDITQAISDYTKALTINPRYEEAYYIRGLAYASQGNLDLASSDYTKAIEINPNYVQAYINRGLIHSNKGALEQAISDFDKVVKINPNIAAAYYLRGTAYANKGNLEQAILDYSKAIEKNPNDASFYANRALAYAYKVVSERTSKIDQNSPMAYINLGGTNIDKADFKNALSDCSKAIEINPNSADAYINRLRVYIFMQEYDKAWEDAHKAEAMGAKIIPQILEDLKQASGREK